MLKEKNSPKQLWGETIAILVYMLNRFPTKKLKEVVPIEKWTRRKKSVNHFKVFGSVCYKHIPNATRRKLDDRSKFMLLIDYHNISAYKLYCPVTKNVEVNKDVIVKESETWDWSKSQSKFSVVSTLESNSASEGDFALEGNSSYEGDSTSEGGSASEGDSDSE